MLRFFNNYTNLKHIQQSLLCDLLQQNSTVAKIIHDTCNISFDSFLANKVNYNVAYSLDHSSENKNYT